MRSFLSLLCLAAVLSGCFNLPVQSTGKVSVINTEPRSAVAKAVSEEKAVSVYDPNSKVETTIQPPSGALSGSKITMPAGALAVAVDLVVEESVPMSETSVASSLNLPADMTIAPVGAGLIIRPSQNVDLTRPLTISMATEALTGLRGWIKNTFLTSSGDYYAVFYKSMIGGELRAGVIPTSSLRLNADGKIEFEGYFGAFWLCKVSAPIEERIEVHTDEPTVNANHVSVIESGGIVTEETIAAKAAIPEVTWTAVTLVYDADLRTGTLKATIASGRSLNSCQVDLRAATDSSSGTNDVVDTSLTYTFAIMKKTAFTLVGRFRCLDDQGRLTISSWSSELQVPAEPDPAVAKSLVINAGAAYTTSTKVSLSLLATGATRMYVTDKSGCSAGGSWEDYSTSKSWTLTQSNDKVEVFVKFQNGRGLESECISAFIVHDNIPPTGLNVMINGENIATASTAVNLTLNATSASHMYLSNSAGCTSGGIWTPFASNVAWVLSQTNATATVYAKFKDLAGNESSCISDSIIHDSIPPTAGNVSINSNASTTTSTTVSLNLSASGASEMFVTNSNSCASGGAWETYTSTRSWSLAQSSGTATVYAKFRDSTGNESACLSDTIAVTVPQPPSTMLQVKGGSDHTCALLLNGQVKCWGYNAYGQLGQGHTQNLGDGPGEMGSLLPPINLGTNRTAVAIAVGHMHSCALLDDGGVKCWGYNYEGQLGQGNTQLIGVNPGEMGDSLPEINLGTGRTAIAISSLYHHTCALLDNHSIKCWGYGPWGNLGYENTNNIGVAPNQMGDALPAVNLGTGRTVKSVATGIHHTCALLDNDSIKCWGYNNEGGLGLGHNQQTGSGPMEMGDYLAAVPLGTGRTAKAVAPGYVHTCALLDNNTVKCWGSNNNGESGQGNTTIYGDNPNELGDNLPAINLGTGRTAIAITSGVRQSCALLDNSTIKCWGFNPFGQLGIGNNYDMGRYPGEMGDALPTVDLGTGRTALAVSDGWHHACAILDNQKIKCWGYNNSGQLGLGHNSNIGDQAGEMGDTLPVVNLDSEIPDVGLKLWLRADSGLYQDAAHTTLATATSDPIAIWEDRSGNGGHMVVAAQLDPNAARPLLNAAGLNGKPVVTFDGYTNLQNVVNYGVNNTIFILGRYTGSTQGRILSANNNNWLLGWYYNSGNAFFVNGWASNPSGTASNNWEVYVGEQTASSQRLFHGSSLVSTTYMGGTYGPDGLSLGGWSICCAEASASEIAEVIVYDRVLSDAERVSVLAYWSYRYGI